jgi:anti-anti-sigma factor
MDFHMQRQGAVTVIKPAGPILGTDAEQFRAIVAEAAASSLGRLVVDASAVSFVDSVGLEALLDLTERLGKAGRPLKLCAVGQTLQEALDITGLSTAFECFPDVNTGVRSFL